VVTNFKGFNNVPSDSLGTQRPARQVCRRFRHDGVALEADAGLSVCRRLGGTEYNDLDAFDAWMASHVARRNAEPTRGQRAVKNLRRKNQSSKSMKSQPTGNAR
jgi:hypothetical protein